VKFPKWLFMRLAPHLSALTLVLIVAARLNNTFGS
jgi:hypothetical protein